MLSDSPGLTRGRLLRFSLEGQDRILGCVGTISIPRANHSLLAHDFRTDPAIKVGFAYPSGEPRMSRRSSSPMSSNLSARDEQAPLVDSYSRLRSFPHSKYSKDRIARLSDRHYT